MRASLMRFLRRIRNGIAHPGVMLDEAVTNYLNRLGFLTIHRYVVHGPKERLHLGVPAPKNNTFFNTRSGHITVGNGVVWGYHCQVLTGVHLFEDGKLKEPKSEQVPDQGYDVQIGDGCWIASGVIVIGGVTIGRNCIAAAGAVITSDVPDGCIVGGVPARIIGYTDPVLQTASAAAQDAGGAQRSPQVETGTR